MRPGAQLPPGAAGSLLILAALAVLGMWSGCAAVYIVTLPGGVYAEAPEPAASAASQPLRELFRRQREQEGKGRP